MELGLAQALTLAPALLLHFVRAGSFLVTCPLFGAQEESRYLRLMLAFSFGAIFWWVGDHDVPLPDSAFGLGRSVIIESMVGLLAGFCIRLLLAVPQIGGEILAAEMGFAISRIVNPVTGSSSTPIAHFYETFATLLIFATGMHHDVIRVLAASYEAVPVGADFDFELVFERLMPLVDRTIQLGLLYAMPILGLMLLLTVVLVVLSRAVQNINLLEFSFGLRILLALAAAILMLAQSAPFLLRVFRSLLSDAHVIFEGA
jgi:flagellar biosynthetic protein FliR